MGRTSRWDRPRPRDLRWFVRLFGKTLIVIGLLMFGFVAYQLWGTGIEFARAQDRAENQFEELMAHGRSDRRTTLPGRRHRRRPRHRRRRRRRRRGPLTSTTAASTTHDSTSTTHRRRRRRFRRRPRRRRSTSPPSPSTTATRSPGWRSRRMGRDDIVVAGVGREELKKGPGHYPQTPDARTAGQRGDRRAPHDVWRTVPGDRRARAGRRDHRDDAVRSIRLPRRRRRRSSTPTTGRSSPPIDPTVATLTLTSCHPVGTASQRIIVHAELDLDAVRHSRPGGVQLWARRGRRRHR